MKITLLFLFRFQLTVLLLLLPFVADSQVQINSVTATPITCPNNGSIAVNATTSTPPLLYSIVAGPVIQPVQTNPVFNSLLPGNYVVKVSDGAGNELTAPATITGTYQNPDFTIADTTPYCIGQSNGKLVGEAIPGKGLAPFTWQLVAPSPVTAGPQNNGTFENLPAGNYLMRITDACGSFSTNAVVLQNPNTGFSFLGSQIGQQGEFISMKTGCDSMLITYWLDIQNPRMPLTFKYNTPGGVFIPSSGTIVDSTFLHSTGQVMVSQIIPGVDYGDMISAVIYNSCGDSAVTMSRIIHPFVFYPNYSFNDCGATAHVSYTNTPFGEYHTSIHTDASYSLTNVTTSTLVESGTVTVQQNNGIISITSAVISGDTYHFSITDGCGDTFESDFTVPAITPPEITNRYIFSGACIDSVVGTYDIFTYGFSSNADLILLSGPSTLGSTKPEFEYSDTYSYPDTIDVSGTTFMMNNLAAGTYQFKIVDDCGNELFDSITITPQQVTSLSRTASVEKGCPGHNKIFYGMINGGNVVIRNTGNNAIVANRDFISYTDDNQASIYNKDSVINLADGSYEITYSFLESPVSQYVEDVNDTDIPCWTLVDTVVIAPYQFPQITAGNVIMCHNEIHLALIPDTTKGVAPYQYEIISGPQTFPVQGNNIFTITEPGTYVARIFDACGNASTTQITVDTLSFDPIQSTSNCTSTSLVLPSSIYWTYEWLMPNNQVHVGDSLILDPVTAADTGIYSISKIININGCIDTLHTTFHVTMPHFLEQTIQYCQGTSVIVGPNTHTTPGIYNDTLTTSAGCDSIVVTHLLILPQNADTTQVTICTGDSIEIGGQYYGVSGFYTDSIQNPAGCYDLVITDLLVHDIIDTINVSICPGGSHPFGGNVYQNSGFYSNTLVSVNGCDSVSVLHLTVQPYIQHAANVTICQGDNYPFGGNLLTQQGIYIDTLATSGCDSIVTLTLAVSPYVHHAASVSTCENAPYPFGGQLLTQSGTYIDTLAASGCDSIVTLTLTVAPYKYNTISQTICVGDTLFIGNHAYTSPGTYTDTLATASCDSILTVTLAVLPLQYSDVYDTICSGEDYPFGGTHYIHTGVYTHPFPTATCDSIVTLHLTVVPAPSVNIITSSYETNDGLFVQLNALSSTSPLDYLWTCSDSLSSYTIPNPTTTLQVPTWVYVTVTDENGCTATDGQQILIPVTSTLYIPNSFTPNGDESNQLFRVYGTNIASFKLEIYDRWGEVIFETTDINYGWDATYQGKMVQDGTYVYKVSAVGMDYVNYEKTGHITVLK